MPHNSGHESEIEMINYDIIKILKLSDHQLKLDWEQYLNNLQFENTHYAMRLVTIVSIAAGSEFSESDWAGLNDAAVTSVPERGASR